MQSVKSSVYNINLKNKKQKTKKNTKKMGKTSDKRALENIAEAAPKKTKHTYTKEEENNILRGLVLSENDITKLVTNVRLLRELKLSNIAAPALQEKAKRLRRAKKEEIEQLMKTVGPTSQRVAEAHPEPAESAPASMVIGKILSYSFFS